MENNNEMMVINREDIASVSMMDNLVNGDHSFFCSIPNDGQRATQVKIYNAINNAKEKLDDHINEVIDCVDVVAHPVSILDENTGEMVDTVRVVIIDAKGTGYEAISVGIVSSLTKLFGIVGKPSYNPPLKMKVIQQKTRKGYKTNTIELV